MRIAHILWSLGTGGTENMVVDIASVQAETDDVAIFVINDWVEQYMIEKLNPKVKLVLCKRKPGSKNPLPLIYLNYKLWEFKPNIIHSHSNRAIYGVKVCKNVPKIRTSHGLGNPSPEFDVYKKIISISEAVNKDVASKGYNSMTIPNGINVDAINSKKNTPFHDGKLHIIQVGRLYIKEKGQDIVIDAVASLKRLGIKNILVHFVGDGPSEQELKKKVAELMVDDMIAFEGRWNQQKVYRNLSNFDLFIQASREEGFGLTIAEAMAAKVPILVSDIPAPMEVIDNGRLGMHFKAGSAQDCAMKIKDFIEKGFNNSTIETAYLYVKEHYEVSITTSRYLEEYNKVLNG